MNHPDRQYPGATESSGWKPIATAPEGVLVETKIDDGRGVRNVQAMKRCNNLWWAGDMYVYYNPTHWREVRDPAPTGREAGNLPQPEEVAARPVATLPPPGGPRSLFPDAEELYDRAMEMSGYDPAKAEVLIRSEWAAARDQMTISMVKCQRQARLVKSQTTL